MARKKILYISGSIGLGHISKDLAVADALRVRNPGVEIIWLAPHPANKQKGDCPLFVTFLLKMFGKIARDWTSS